MTKFKTIDQLLSDYKIGYSLEQEFYKNPDIYQKEINNILDLQYAKKEDNTKGSANVIKAGSKPTKEVKTSKPIF